MREIQLTCQFPAFSCEFFIRHVKLFHNLLPAAGLEPARCCHRGILSPLRLPIPPCRQDAINQMRVSTRKLCFLAAGTRKCNREDVSDNGKMT